MSQLKKYIILFYFMYSSIIGFMNLRHTWTLPPYTPDEQSYLFSARRIVQNPSVKTIMKMNRMPYRVFIAGIFWSCGENLGAVRVVQTIMGIAAGFLCLLIAMRLFGNAGGFLLALLLMFFPFHLCMNDRILTETLTGFLTALFFYSLFDLKKSFIYVLVTIISAILLIKLRPEGVFVIVALLCWLLVNINSRFQRKTIIVCMLSLLGIGIFFFGKSLSIILPEYVCHKLYLEALPAHFAGQYQAYPRVGAARFPGNVVYHQENTLKEMGDTNEKKKELIKYAFQNIKNEPFNFFMGKRISRFLGLWTRTPYCSGFYLGWNLVLFNILLIVAAFGVFASIVLKRKELIVIFLAIVVENVIFILFSGGPRHNVPMMPFVFMFSGYAILKLCHIGRAAFGGNFRGDIIEKLNRHRVALALMVLIGTGVMIMEPVVEERSRYADIEAARFYDDGWEIIKVDDGLGTEAKKGFFPILSNCKTILKKEIHLDCDPADVERVKVAYYTACFPYKPEGTEVAFDINGKEILKGPLAYYGQYGYNEIPFEPELLKRGKNTITIRKVKGSGYLYILTDNDTYEKCSWKSMDLGKTWVPFLRYGSKQLGELMIRLVIFKKKDECIKQNNETRKTGESWLFPDKNEAHPVIS